VTRREDGCADKLELTVVVPEESPLLTPPAAAALLRLLDARHADARRSGPAQVVPAEAERR